MIRGLGFSVDGDCVDGSKGISRNLCSQVDSFTLSIDQTYTRALENDLHS